jgi:hypothetical protein
MKIEEAVECMSKSYLHRIIDSYTKDIKKPDEDDARKMLISDAELLANPENIKKRLNLKNLSFDSKILSQFIIEIFLDCENYTADENFILDEVTRIENTIVAEAASPDIFKFKQAESINTYKTVLEVALEDNQISDDEKRLLAKLRSHLGLNLRDHYLIQATLNKFPKADNQVHTIKEIKSELNDLQRRGIVFFCNLCNSKAQYVIPSELVPSVKVILGIELSETAYNLLLDKLSKDSLKVILDSSNLPVSGKKEDQIQRIVKADLLPSIALNSLSVDELYSLCKALPGVNLSGSKATRIANVIEHFDKLRTVSFTEDTDPRERFYNYYVELAKRDRQNLLSNNIIQKDINMESAFEEATRYIFEEKLGLVLLPMEGSNHPDGILEFGKAKELLMWDTKSKETIYEFPNDHFRQFKNYIHESVQRVSCFLVIAPEISDRCLDNAYKLKGASGCDADVALISAEDLKWIAENWKSYVTKSKKFDLEVLNHTGILDSQSIKQRMKVFLK